MGGGKFLTVKRVEPTAIDVTYPCFLQRMLADATHDVTVAYIAGKLYASELARNGTADGRVSAANGKAEWVPCELTPEQSGDICRMMRETGLSFSRLDFLRDSSGTLHFLEFNPNGQFAWLDLHDERGLLTAVAQEILRVHATHCR